MIQHIVWYVAVVGIVLASVDYVSADTFSTGSNQFTIDFVTISGDASSANGTIIGHAPRSPIYRYFTDPGNDYRMGVHEITNDQWSKFQASLGVPVTGNPSNAYDANPYYTGTHIPVNNVSWYEAAQFVNWLNTSTGHQAAYKFNGTQGTSGYTLTTWEASEADGGSNLYRNKNAIYFLPTDDEWVKAAYWNGTTLQTYATKPGDVLHKGDGVSGTGWNYNDDPGSFPPPPPGSPWDVGSGSEELNGTFDMMGNASEWMENALVSGDYGTDSDRGERGGSFFGNAKSLKSSAGTYEAPYGEYNTIGFRVASVPEPASLGLLMLGALALLKRKCGK